MNYLTALGCKYLNYSLVDTVAYLYITWVCIKNVFVDNNYNIIKVITIDSTWGKVKYDTEISIDVKTLMTTKLLYFMHNTFRRIQVIFPGHWHRNNSVPSYMIYL